MRSAQMTSLRRHIAWLKTTEQDGTSFIKYRIYWKLGRKTRALDQIQSADPWGNNWSTLDKVQLLYSLHIFDRRERPAETGVPLR